MQEPLNHLKLEKKNHARQKTIPDWLRRAQILVENGESQLAIRMLRTLLVTHAKETLLVQGLAELLEQNKKFQEAIALRRALLKSHYNFWNLYSYAHSLYLSGNDEHALVYFFESLSILDETSPVLFSLYKNIGNILLRQGDFDGAEEYYNRAYGLNSNSDVLYVNLGTLEMQKQDYEKAAFCYREGIRLNIKNDKAWVGLALIHSLKGDIDLAWGSVRKAVEINPENRTAVMLLLEWAQTHNRLNEALDPAQEYLHQVNHDLEVSEQLIHLFLKLGKIQSAQIEMQRAILFCEDLNSETYSNLIKLQKSCEILAENGG